MQLIPVKTRILNPPQDDLFQALIESPLALKEGDIVAIASKVVAISEGRCVKRESLTQKDELTRQESQFYLEREEVPGKVIMHAIVNEQLAVSAGIDPFGDYYILWPENPQQSAEYLEHALKQHFKIKKLGVIITDSKSTLLRRGVVGGAIGWAGFNPLFDNRVRKDLLGTKTGGSQINVADSVASAAVLVMGEGVEQTPVVVVRDAPYAFGAHIQKKQSGVSYVVLREEDIFGTFINHPNWRTGGASK